MVSITSGLFSADYKSNRSASPIAMHSQSRSTTTDSQQPAGLGKRKRRADSDEDGPKTNYSPQSRSSPTSKGLLRLHGHISTSDTSNNRMYPVSVSSNFPSMERRPVKQLRRLNPKVALVKSTSHLMDTEPDPAPSCTNTNSHSDLRPCHACNTAPKRKRDLENFMECTRCVERACYICARECAECRKAVCKKCVLEVGQQGDPWCLFCYSRRLNS